MTRVLVLGAAGMLGHKLIERLSGRFTVTGTVRDKEVPIELVPFVGAGQVQTSVSVLDDLSLRTALNEAQPEVVINAVGVVKQLAAAKDGVVTIETNALLPHRLARLGAEFGFRLIHISTDCVFSGAAGPYDEMAIADARDLYGRSKLLGEVGGPRQLTLRTSIVGRELRGHHALVDWLLGASGKVSGYVNALYSGLTTLALADLVARVIEEAPDLEGLWHVSGDAISKFDLLMLVKAAYGLPVEIEPNTEFRCDRRLDSGRFRAAMRWQPSTWPDMVAEMAADEVKYRFGSSAKSLGEYRVGA